jgi:hypothetical protein
MDARRIGTFAHRAAHDVVEDVGHDLWFAVVALLLATLVGVWVFGLPWDEFVLANLIGFALIPVLAFLYRFVRTVHRPERHKSWERRPSDFIPIPEGKQAPGILRVQIAPLKATYVGRNACEITDPDGNVWLEGEEAWPDRPALIRTLGTHYPDAFPGAPPMKSGVYQVRWLLGVGRKGWREIMRYSETITVPEEEAEEEDGQG